MSTESQPPSIAPRGPAAGTRPDTAPRRVTTPVSGDGAPSVAVTESDAVTSQVEAGPSFGDRMKKAAQGAAASARTALPTRGADGEVDAPAASAPVAASPSFASPASTPASPRVGAASPRVAAGPAGTTTTESAGPRRVRLAIARIDPWSVMKLSFLLSFAIGIMIVVSASVIWYTLNNLNVFTQVNDVIATLSGSTTFFDVLEYAKFERVVSLAAMVAVVDIVLLTALATIGAFLYNIVAAMVGGIHLTLTDD